MIRELINKLSISLSERNVPLRRKHCAPIKLWFDPDQNTERAHEIARSSCILGETTDISRNGIGFIVPMIRLKEKYLAGQERVLNAEIDLPTGKVALRLVGTRYEMVGIHLSAERFLIGARIVTMSEPDKELYETFLRHGKRRPRGVPRPAGAVID